MVESRRLSALISGRVQGVGFRFFTVREADTRGLTGWVRNKGENQVQVVAEGPPAALQDFLQALHTGPPLAWVAQVQVEWSAATGEFSNFGARAGTW